MISMELNATISAAIPLRRLAVPALSSAFFETRRNHPSVVSIPFLLTTERRGSFCVSERPLFTGRPFLLFPSCSLQPRRDFFEFMTVSPFFGIRS